MKRSIFLSGQRRLFCCGIALLAFAGRHAACAQSFEAPRNFAVGTQPNCVKAADFNGDGKLDLIIGRDNAAGIAILLGNGDGTFQAATNISAGTQPRLVDVADFDGDGKMDIVTANYGGNNVSVLLGNGNGTFKPAVNYATGANPRSIVVGNLSGKIGIVAANVTDNNVSVFVGNGDGTFKPAVNYPVGSNPIGVSLGDFNGDSKLDIVTANYGSNNASILLGNGDGTFQAALTATAGSNPSFVAVGDFNGDGKRDLAVTNANGNNVSILLGNGNGTFQPAASPSVGSDPRTVAVADFNHNGKDDLAITNFNDGNVSTLLSNGNGTFQTLTNKATGSGSEYVLAGDFNGDSWSDLAVVNENAGTVSILLNNKGLSVYYTFDEGSGTVANDASGNGNTGTLTNGPVWTTGIKGNALSFDGTNDYINDAGFSWPTGGPVTIAFWNYVDQPQESFCFGVGAGGAIRMSANVPYSDQMLYWDYGDSFGNGRVSLSYSPYLGKWTHVALVSAGIGGNFKAIYINGQLAASGAVSDGPNTPLSTLHVGHAPEKLVGTFHHRGKVDDFRIYNRVLSAAEIGALVPPVLGPVVQYNFDEGTGTVANDDSGNGNTGTLTNGPAWTSGVHGGALSFDGVNDYVNDAGFSWPAGGAVTVAFWNYVSASQTKESCAFGAGLGQSNRFQAHVPYSDKILYWDYGDYAGIGRISCNYSPHLDKWTHVTLVSGGIGGNFKAIYLDGQLAVSSNSSDGPHAAQTILHVGNSPENSSNPTFHNGKIDDFRIYNRVLALSEIQALAQASPIAANDSYGAAAGQQTSVAAPGVLSNDQPIAGTTASAILDTNVTHGILALNSNGSFTYTATAGFAGTDSFTYHITDNLGGLSTVATVTITVINLTVASISPTSGTVGQTLANVTVNGSGFRSAAIPPGAVAFNGHNYLYVTTGMNWHAAKAYCQTQGGHLVSIGSDAENTFVKNLANAEKWIGFTDEAVEGTFVWVNNEAITYTNWAPGEPNNSGGAQDFGYQYPAGNWDDSDGTPNKAFVCEFDQLPPPAVQLKKGAAFINATNVRLNSSSQMIVDFNLTGAAAGTWDVVVIDPVTSAAATLSGGFQISQASTTIVAGNGPAVTYKSIAQNIILNAVVTPQFGKLNDGTVTFQLKSGASDVGSPSTSGTLVNGATGNVIYIVPAGTAPGTYTISAAYNGTPGYAGSSDTSKQVTINPATITVTGINASRAYGAANPNFTGTLIGVQIDDGITASFDTSATVLSAAGTYPIVPTLLDPNNNLNNYTVVSTNGTLTVTKAPLTAVAFNATRTYGAANPLFSGILSGVLNGDNILATYDTSANAGSPIGLYAIVPQLSDPDGKAGNYAASLSNGALSVTKAALAVTPADASRPYGAPNPAFSGTITGIQNNDFITATYATSAGPSSTVGTYTISAALIDPNNRLGNYAVTPGVGTLSISKGAPAIIWAAPARIVAGNPLSAVQLNAAAQDAFSAAPLAGTFDYSPVDGTLLPAGLGQVLSVTFTPADAANYTSTTVQTSIDVDPAIPPRITSVLSASIAKDAAFSYTLTADGTTPIAFNATGLPPGLSFIGTDITGSPSATGVFNITLSATNFGGSDTKNLKLTIVGSGTNHPPAITFPPTPSANPAITGTPVVFVVQATDDDGDALDYVWDFGDGTSGLGASVSKTYAAASVYVVTLTVSDGQASVVQSLNLVVNEQPSVGTFAVDKVKLAFNFVKRGKDSLSLSGRVTLPAGFSPANKSVRVLIGLLDVQTTLTSKGRSADRTFTLIGKRGSNTAKFTFALKNNDLFAKLQGLGFSKAQSNSSVLSMPVIVVLDGQSNLDQPLIKYAVKSGKAGPSSGKGQK